MSMTEQEIFDRVATHLLKQGRKATELAAISHGGDSMLRCRYRTDDGLRCAVGCLIPDEVYTPAIEGVTVFEVAEKLIPTDARAVFLFLSALESSGIDHNDGALMSLLQSLQELHDASEPEAWPEELAKLAHRRNLSPAALGVKP